MGFVPMEVTGPFSNKPISEIAMEYDQAMRHRTYVQNRNANRPRQSTSVASKLFVQLNDYESFVWYRFIGGQAPCLPEIGERYAG